ncbi:MAG: 30S ribosomal protein S20 [Candidatus Omnitrophota bacterium]
MPQKRAAYKEIRKSKKRRVRNIRITSELKTLVKEYNVLLAEKKFDQAKEFLKEVVSKLSKAARKGVIHQNTVSRKISRLAKKLRRA